MIHPYVAAYRDGLNKLYPNLVDTLYVLPKLPQPMGSSALQFLLSFACQSSNSTNIQLGREGLKSIPHDWLLGNIESEVKGLLNLEDEWEFRRLAEIYCKLDTGLANRLAQIGLQSKNEEVVEAAKDLLDWIVDAGE